MANEPEVLRGVLANRVAKNARHLAKWAKRESVTCYRVYDRDIPEIPIAIDRYEQDLVLHDFRASDRGGGELWLEAMVAGARDALPEISEIFVKARERLAHRGEGGQYERGPERASIVRAVAEGGHAFKINLTDYIDVGLFLDHRTTRKLVAAEAGESMLNLFAYTGAFSVYAHGAGKRTTTVDLSNTYIEWAKENFELNEMRGGELVREDVRTFLQAARTKGRKWDIVVADVPTFSNSKSTAYTWDVQRDHVAFLDDLAAVANNVIWFATNNRRFKFGWSHKNWQAEPMSHATLPPDFRDQRIHQAFRIAR